MFKKLSGGRGFVLTEYEPVGSHGGPIHTIFYKFRTPILCTTWHVGMGGSPPPPHPPTKKLPEPAGWGGCAPPHPLHLWGG